MVMDLSVSSDKSRASSGGIRMAMSPQQFCLRWNNHQSNFVSVFEQLLQTELFVDVTIAVEGRTLKAHKMVLSACSPYFQAVLASHPDKHPIVILKDVRYTDMRDLLDFMYRGEASVDQENLPTFLRVAECLRIKGLTEVGDKRGESIPSPYLIQQGVSSNSTNVSSNGSIAIAPPSTLPGAPLTPLPGDPPPLKRPPLSPSATGAKRRRGRPPKISGEDSELDVGISHDEESRSDCVGGVSIIAGLPGNHAMESEIKTESDEGMDHKDSDSSRPPSHQAGETKPGPSGEHPPRDLSKSCTEETDSTRQSPGSGLPQHSESSWHPLPAHHDYDQDEYSNLSGMSSHPSPLALVSPMPKHPSPVPDIDKLNYTKNLLEAAMRKNPYDPIKDSNYLQGSILLASLRSPLKFGNFQGVYGERDPMEREYLETSPHHPHASPQKPSQSTPSLPSPGIPGPAGGGATNPGSGSNSSNGNGSPHNSHPNISGGGLGGSSGGGKGVSVPIMSYCIQDNGFKCSKCFQTFTHPSNFHRHYITVHTDRRNHKCTVCGKEFKRKDNMMSHMRSVHRPGREGHAMFRDVTSVSPSLSCDLNPIKCEKGPQSQLSVKAFSQTGREGHGLFSDVSSVSPSLTCDMSAVKCEKVQSTQLHDKALGQPEREGHGIFRDVTSVTQSLSCDIGR